jgi:hypothetical protein
VFRRPWSIEGEEQKKSKQINKQRDKFALVHVLKVYGEKRSIAPLIRNVGSRWKWMMNVAPGRFAPRNEARYFWVGPRVRLDLFGEEQNLFSPSVYKHRIDQPVAWSLFSLRYPGFSGFLR